MSDGLYRKKLADTLDKKTIREQAKRITELENRKPQVITKIVYKLKEVEKPTDNISVSEDTIKIIDYYPNKTNPFLKYTNTLSLTNKKGISKFEFYDFEINGVLLQRSDGLFELDLKVPDFMKIGTIDIQALPQKIQEKDNWGYLFGVEYGRDLDTDKNLININSYIRFKKFYIGGQFNTNNTYSYGIKIEF